MKIRAFIILTAMLMVSLMMQGQVKKVAILETVDREGNVAYAHKLMLRANLAKAVAQAPGYEAYDRTDMDAIMGEQNFQRTGMVSDDQIKRLGEMTGAAYILVAEAVRVDEYNMFITAKILNVETAKTEITDNALMGATPSDIQHGCESLAAKLLGVNMISISPTPQSEPQKSNESVARTQPEPQNVEPPIQPIQPSQNVIVQPVVQQSQNIIGSVKIFPDGSRGIVFYVDATGRGLAVSMDQTTAPWQNARRSRELVDIKLIPNEENPSKFCNIGLGQEYTNYLINQIGTSATAATWCVQHGSGWYLPSVGEVYQLLKVANQGRERNGPISIALVNNGGQPLMTSWFWSSNENDNDEAFNVSQNGWVSTEDKNEDCAVRAVRAF